MVVYLVKFMILMESPQPHTEDNNLLVYLSYKQIDGG